MGGLIKQDEGLPNILGDWDSAQGYWSSEGAIYGIYNGSREHNQSNSGYRAYFDAERGRKFWEERETGVQPTNTIYGNSYHVTVDNFTTKIWKRIS